MAFCRSSALMLALLAGAAVCAMSQEIRTYTRQELFAGQICGDDGPDWEGKNIGECPQGYNGLRRWAKERGLLPGSKATVSADDKPGSYTVQKEWPYCNPCKDNQACFEFKPGVAKCITKTDEGEQFLGEGDICMVGDKGKVKKWIAPNPKLYGMSCQWPSHSCNYDAKANDGTYRCERIREYAGGPPTNKCYRALGGRWWGGSDQWYAFNDNNKFIPCGGPNPHYKKCSEFPNCAGKPRPWADEKGVDNV